MMYGISLVFLIRLDGFLPASGKTLEPELALQIIKPSVSTEETDGSDYSAV
jgi:hypothetical protein